jgi:hypothetical protein
LHQGCAVYQRNGPRPPVWQSGRGLS